MAIELVGYPTLYEDANLVHYWKLENTSDSKGSMTLTNNNSVEFNAGKFNNAADFGTANTNKGLTETATNTITYDQFAGAWSVNVWVNLANYDNTVNYFWWLRVTDGTRCRQVGLNYNTDGTKRFGLYPFPNTSNSQDTWEPAYDMSTGVWHMVTFTFNGSNLFSLYVDGNSNPLDTHEWAGFGTYNLNSKIWDIGFPVYLNGLVDDVSVFTRELSGAEIAAYYTAVPAGGTVRDMIGPGFIPFAR